MKTNIASWKEEWGYHLLLLIAVFLMLWPIVFMLSTSLKDLNQVFESTLNPLPFPPTFANYTNVLENFPLLTYIWNTFYIAIVVTFSKALTSVLAAFGFVYYDFKYKETIFNGMLLTFFIPITVLIMPNYLLMAKLGLLDTPLWCYVTEPSGRHGCFPDAPDHARHPQAAFGSSNFGRSNTVADFVQGGAALD